ncbi:MAG TPA: hypothetical protein VK177_10740 [Flavobacteriales bacterium]|nr:hypothetical protein [Flavobacteriales bacterium]
MKILLALSIVCFLYACQNKNSKENTGTESSIDSIDPNRGKALFTLKDSLQDDLARYLAGMPQTHKNGFQELEKEAFWINYKNRMNAAWKKVIEQRLGPISEWDSTFFSKKVNDSLPLIYPFSGPDVLHAYYLFPRVQTYVLMALEQLNDLPQLEKLNKDSRKLYFNSLENSLRDVLSKSYFVTTHMGSDLHGERVRGVLPLLYFFVVRSGLEIRQVEQLVIDSTGLPAKSNWVNTGKKVKAVKMIVRDPKTETEKTIFYISCNLSNTGLNFNRGVMKFVDAMGTCNTFIKAASYMPHYSTFKTLRDTLINQSDLIFEDDTGFPYKYFKNKKKYEVDLFGDYAKPVKDFGDYAWQKDLDSVYRKDSLKIQKLGFHLGYHWGDLKQAILLIRKKK